MVNCRNREVKINDCAGETNLHHFLHIWIAWLAGWLQSRCTAGFTRLNDSAVALGWLVTSFCPSSVLFCVLTQLRKSVAEFNITQPPVPLSVIFKRVKQMCRCTSFNSTSWKCYTLKNKCSCVLNGRLCQCFSFRGFVFTEALNDIFCNVK